MDDVTSDDRKQRVLATARAFLDHQPSPREAEEDEERRQSNRLAALLARPAAVDSDAAQVRKPASSGLHYRRKDDAMVQSAADVLRARATLGERLTPADYAAVVSDDTSREVATLCREIGADRRTRLLVRRILVEIAAARIGQYAKRCELEDRLAALEAAAKPRHRVKAPTRPSS